MPARQMIDPLWQPAAADREYAQERGLAIEREAANFVDHHRAKGTRYSDWGAAWRMWCRRAVDFGRGSVQRQIPLLAIVDGLQPRADPDPYGADHWARTLPGVECGRFDGELRPMLCGMDVAGVARDFCEAAAYAESWRGDLSAVADWLRAGVDPDAAVDVIRRRRRPGVSLRWYDEAVRRPASPQTAYRRSVSNER